MGPADSFISDEGVKLKRRDSVGLQEEKEVLILLQITTRLLNSRLDYHERARQSRMIIKDGKGASHHGFIKDNVSLIDTTFFHGTF